MQRLSSMLIILAASIAVPSQATEPPATTVFASLKTLVGDWRSTDPANATRVSYTLVANGSSIVESWTMSPTCAHC